MSSLFALLFFIATGLLIWGFVSPESFKKLSHKRLARKQIFFSVGSAAIVLLALACATTPPQQRQAASEAATSGLQQAAQQTQKQAAKPKPKVEVKQEAVTKPVPFTTSTLDDSTLPSGTAQVVQEGVNGTETDNYEVTYTNGKETTRVLKTKAVTTQPTPKIVHNGTYVKPTMPSCPDGYINTYGNCVHSPSSDPTGASARCADGTYSYSQSRRGTCSHHGGVAAWL